MELLNEVKSILLITANYVNQVFESW